MYDQYSNQRLVDDLVTDPRRRVIIEEKNEAYLAFLKGLSKIHASVVNPFVQMHDFPDQKLSFVCINSTITSTSNMFGPEQGRLSVPLAPIFDAQNKINKERFVVSVTHHPFSWFNDSIHADLERSIADMADLHLFGHLHDADPVHRLSPTGETTYLQAPSLFEHRKAPNGYCLIYLAGGKPKLEYRTYFDAPRKFGSGENVIPGGGIFFPNTAAEEYWSRFPRALGAKKFRNWLGGRALSDLLLRTTDPVTGQVISEYFVAPPLVKIELIKGDDIEDIKPDKRVSLSEIIDGDRNVIFAAPAERGHTTLANYFAFEILSASKVGPNPRLPVYVNLNETKIYGDTLRREIKNALSDVSVELTDAESLMSSRSLVVLLDDVDLESLGTAKRLFTSMTRLPKVRFILFAKTSMPKEMFTLIDDVVKDFDTYVIRPFTLP